MSITDEQLLAMLADHVEAAAGLVEELFQRGVIPGPEPSVAQQEDGFADLMREANRGQSQGEET